MPTVRYSDESGRYRVAGQTFEPGDEGDVSDPLAAYLVEDVGRFERVEPDDDPDTCDVVKSDGEVCGRTLPCQYHTEGS